MLIYLKKVPGSNKMKWCTRMQHLLLSVVEVVAVVLVVEEVVALNSSGQFRMGKRKITKFLI